MQVKHGAGSMRMVLAWGMVVLCLSGCSNGPKDEPRDLGTSAQAISTVGAVLTYHNDNARTGQNPAETTLTYAAVQQQFGKLYTFAVDDNVYAQPLYVPGLSINGNVHNAVYVATESNSIYVFDADMGTQITHWTFLSPIPSSAVLPSCGCKNITPYIGITGTPVIDATTSTLYFVTSVSGSTGYAQYVNAVDLATGVHKYGSPVAVSAAVPGDGPESVGGQILFDPARALQRPGLLLQSGRVYVAWGSQCDDAIHFPQEWFHGWVMSFAAQNLSTAPLVLNTTPHADGSLPSCGTACGTACGQTQCTASCCSELCGGTCTQTCVIAPYGGSVWQGGAGLASDGSYIYANTGNGLFDPTHHDLGDSTIAINLSTLTVSSSFTPPDQASLRAHDWDLSGGGVVLLPDGLNTQYPHLVATAGKAGTVYLLDRDALGGGGLATDACAVGVVDLSYNSCTNPLNAFFGVPAYFNGRLYFGGNCDKMKAFAVGNTNPPLGALPAAVSTDGGYYPYPGVVPSVSANGTSNGIVWAARRAPNANPTPSCSVSSSAVSALIAYRADTLAVLYDSSKVAGNSPGAVVQFTTPTVAGGKVFVGGNQTVTVYGVLPGCSAITCPSGCCQSGTCVSPTNATCGTNGAACQACPSSYTCVSGACTAPAYAGFLDSATCTQVAGWAWDGNQPNTPINVDVSVDGVLQSTVAANLFRQDLLNAGLGNGYHAYQWSLPASFDDGAPHSVNVTFSGTSLSLSNSPKSVTCGCGLANCASGCCQNGACVTGAGNAACGTGGAACQACPSGWACFNNACLSCSPANCASGCCQNGTCVTGTATSACGTSGATCRTCPSGASCVNNACVGNGIPCGTNYCGSGTYCCNSSCGICAPVGGNCTQQYCPPDQ